MSLSSCNCPLPAAIGNITPNTCPENFGQIQKVIFQRKGFIFDGTTGKDITLLADWQALIVETDDTKVQVSPFMYNPIITAGESITNGGGDNSTLNGESELVGVNPSVFTAEFRSLNSATIAQLQALNCESTLGVYFVTKDQKIIAKKSGTVDYTTFDISSLFVGDKTNSGFATKDMNAFSFNVAACWSAEYLIATPAFNPLTEI